MNKASRSPGPMARGPAQEGRAGRTASCDSGAPADGARNAREVLARLLASIAHILPHEAANISLIEGGVSRVICSAGYDRFGIETDRREVQLPVAETANLRSMMATGQPLIIPDVADYSGWIEIPHSRWIRSHAGAPIRAEGQVIGFLGLDSSVPGFFSETHAAPLQVLADQAGIVIENARLNAQVRRQRAELEREIAERTAELARQEAALRTANQQLQEIDRLKSQFISSVSHDLRTPLTNIKLLIELIERNKPNRLQDCLAAIKRELNLLEDAITDLLDLSRLDLGQTRPQLSATDVSGLVRTLAADRTALAATKGLALNIEADLDTPPAFADVRLLLRAVGNLLSNAINYTPPGGSVTLLIRRRPRQGREWVTIEVRDTGPGIAEDELPRLFERFYRGTAALQTGATGTGLGLAICREIVALLGGLLTVDSKLGSGSSFTLWLPPAAR